MGVGLEMTPRIEMLFRKKEMCKTFRVFSLRAEVIEQIRDGKTSSYLDIGLNL